MEITLLGTGSSSIALANAMGIRRNLKKADIAILWGLKKVELCDNPQYNYVINNPRELKATANKHKQLSKLAENNIPVPTFSLTPLTSKPMLGRDFYHSRGTDIEFFDILTPIKPRDYYIEFIPNCKERRYHVIGGQVVSSCYKFGGDRTGKGEYCKNLTTGWHFQEFTGKIEEKNLAIEAVKALGYDFGAVDILIAQNSNRYVLEVNTAPGLCMPRLEQYANYLYYLAEKLYTGDDSIIPDEEDPTNTYEVCFERTYTYTTRITGETRDVAENNAWDNLPAPPDEGEWNANDTEVYESCIVDNNS